MKNLIFILTILSSTLFGQNFDAFTMGTDETKTVKLFEIDTVFVTNKFVIEISDDNWIHTNDVIKYFFINERPNLVDLYGISVYDTTFFDKPRVEYVYDFDESYNQVIVDSTIINFEVKEKDFWLTRLGFDDAKNYRFPNVTYKDCIVQTHKYEAIKSILENNNYVVYMEFNGSEWVQVSKDNVLKSDYNSAVEFAIDYMNKQ